MLVKKLIGKEVISNHGDKIGKIADFDIDVLSSKVKSAIIVASFNKTYKIKLDDIVTIGDSIILRLNAEDLKKAAAPKWTYAGDLCRPPKEFGPYTEDTLIPRFTQTDSIHIVVTGGPGKQSQIYPGFPTNFRVVSVSVEK